MIENVIAINIIHKLMMPPTYFLNDGPEVCMYERKLCYVIMLHCRINTRVIQ